MSKSTIDDVVHHYMKTVIETALKHVVSSSLLSLKLIMHGAYCVQNQ